MIHTYPVIVIGTKWKFLYQAFFQLILLVLESSWLILLFFSPHTKCLVIYILLHWAQNLAKLKRVQGTLGWYRVGVVWKITGIGSSIVSLINTGSVHNCLALNMLESENFVVFGAMIEIGFGKYVYSNVILRIYCQEQMRGPSKTRKRNPCSWKFGGTMILREICFYYNQFQSFF